MSGVGQRFVDAGYRSPKPLIHVDGKTIIEYVTSMFPGSHEFIFICNSEHLRSTTMKDILVSIKPECRIVAVPPHKEGPVYAITHAYDYIGDNEDVLISYCDYYMEWDFDEMVRVVNEGGYDGAVPCYTGFHPHLLHKKLYGGVLVDENNRMLDYKEKHSFTENPEDSYHSVGAYYFKTGRDLKKYSNELLQSDIHINGEKYTSMVYYLYLRDRKKIYVPEVSRFMQWGTPEDLEEYESWSRYFHKKLGRGKPTTDIPQERERLIKIPYEEGTVNFKKCYNYWESYFKKL